LPAKDPIEEATKIIENSQKRGIILRLLGGVAFRLRSPSALHMSLTRKYVDIDLIGLRKQGSNISSLFKEMGYVPRTTFNALNGASRMIFNDLENERRVDVFLNTFEMCHKFDFSNRLKVDKITLPLCDLLLTKLQVYEITEREYKDMIAFLKDHTLSDSDEEESINRAYIATLCGEDWGLYKTVSLNLARLEEALQGYLKDSEASLVRNRILDLKNAIEIAPKSFRWKVRARVGEKVRWYELPEADREVVDSRPVEQNVDVKIQLPEKKAL
jgi:hypothetical protein